MTENRAYDLDQFIADCRTTLARDPGPAGREQVMQNLECLLANKDFIAKHCGDDQPVGIKVLYEDPKLGFQVLSHVMDKARVSPPHDHGKSWAIYGQAAQWTDMIEWAREDDGSDPKHAKLKPVKKYRLTPGKAGIYQDGAIHSIDYPDNARFIRVTGTDLDKIERIKIDLKTGEVATMRMMAS
jgi:predicted metal-dependent enzyme (double-stranded beta helix superfamily)